MPNKQDKLAELERQYQEQIAKIESEADEDDDDGDDDIIILRGNARKRFLAKLDKMGINMDEAEEIADEAEEEAEENAEDESAEEVTEEKTPRKRTSKKADKQDKETGNEKEEVVEDDPKPPSRHRFFG